MSDDKKKKIKKNAEMATILANSGHNMDLK